MPVPPRRVLPLIALAIACTASAQRATSVRADRPPPTPFDAGEVECAVRRATNAARRARGLPPLTWEGRLLRAARGHSADMGRRDYFAHASPDGDGATERAAATGFACRTELGRGRYREGVAENLFSGHAYRGYTGRSGPRGTTRTYDAHSLGSLARAVVDGWLRSPGHRRNLLDPVTRREAVGAWIGRDGRVFVTQALC